jgi:hypothetical protein
MAEIERGARVRITQPLKSRPTEVFEARVSWAEDRGGFIYFGFRPFDSKFGAWGCCRHYKNPATRPPFAAIVEVLEG